MLNERIAAFVKRADEVIAENWKNNIGQPPTHEVEYGDKWAKVWTWQKINDKPTRASIYAFIALQDFTNRTLGTVKAGDIHRPASTAAPAKHARGSVFQDDFGNCIGPYGVAYLK